LSNDKETSTNISDAAREEKLTEHEILRQSLEEKIALARDYYDQLLRLKAEFDNFRKRSEKEKQAYMQWGKEEILLKQINVLDVLDQAVKSAKDSNNIESIIKGLGLINGEMSKMLADEGVKEIESVGKKFDPELHYAVEKIESDAEEDTILEVVQKGYMFNSRVIRPAKVKVAKHAASNKK